MSQDEVLGPVAESVGYVLKQAASALRGAMDEVLRPLELTVSQYSALEVLAQRPGVSGSELARATFVSRQSANLVLQGLERRGLLARAAVAPHGRALPVELTASGHDVLRSASAAVRDVERRMLAQLSTAARRRLLHDLTTCVEALAGGIGDETSSG